MLNRGTNYLSDLTWRSATNGYGPVKLDENYGGDPLTIHGVSYDKGLWTNAEAELVYDLRGDCSRLTADLGIDDSTLGRGSVVYEVWADGARVFDSGTVTAATPTIALDVGLSGASELRLVVDDAGDGGVHDNADWGDAQLTCGV